MFKRILVPTDHSPKSFKALEMACQVAGKTGGEIDLVHIVQAALSVNTSPEGNYESKGNKGQQFLQDILAVNQSQMENLRDNFSHLGIPINIRLKVDGFPEKVAELITSEAYDLLVVGSTVHRGFEEYLQIHVPEKIIQLAKAPVLTVKQDIPEFSLKRILVPINFHITWLELIPLLEKLQSVFDSELFFLFINSPGNFKTTYETGQYINDIQTRYPLKNAAYHVINDLNINKGILKASEYFQADIIACISKRQRSIFNLIKGETTEYLVNHALSPVLTLNNQINE